MLCFIIKTLFCRNGVNVHSTSQSYRFKACDLLTCLHKQTSGELSRGAGRKRKNNEYNNDESCVGSHKPKLDEVQTETAYVTWSFPPTLITSVGNDNILINVNES